MQVFRKPVCVYQVIVVQYENNHKSFEYFCFCLDYVKCFKDLRQTDVTYFI